MDKIYLFMVLLISYIELRKYCFIKTDRSIIIHIALVTGLYTVTHVASFAMIRGVDSIESMGLPIVMHIAFLVLSYCLMVGIKRKHYVTGYKVRTIMTWLICFLIYILYILVYCVVV